MNIDVKIIRKNLNEYMDAQLKRGEYEEKMREAFSKIKTKLSFLLLPSEDPKLRSIKYCEWGDIYFEFKRYSDSLLSKYFTWSQEGRDLVKPAIIEILLFLKLKKEHEKQNRQVHELERNFETEIMEKLDLYRRNTKLRNIWIPISRQVEVDVEKTKGAKKELAEISDEELLKMKRS